MSESVPLVPVPDDTPSLPAPNTAPPLPAWRKGWDLVKKSSWGQIALLLVLGFFLLIWSPMAAYKFWNLSVDMAPPNLQEVVVLSPDRFDESILPREVGATLQIQVEELDDQSYKSVPIAFAACALVVAGPSVRPWIVESRRLNNESKTLDPLMQNFRTHRCLQHPSLVPLWKPSLKEIGEGVTLAKLQEAMLHLPDKALDWARVQSVFISREGEPAFSVLVLNPKTARFELRLVRHMHLFHVLKAWEAQQRKGLGGHAMVSPPSLCPIHLGLLGSGMAFTTDPLPQLPSVAQSQRPLLQWLRPGKGQEERVRVLLDVKLAYWKRQKACTAFPTVSYSSRLSRFPYDLDADIWPPPADPLAKKNQWKEYHEEGEDSGAEEDEGVRTHCLFQDPHVTAYDPLPLYLRDVPEELDAMAHTQWLQHPYDIQYAIDQHESLLEEAGGGGGVDREAPEIRTGADPDDPLAEEEVVFKEIPSGLSGKKRERWSADLEKFQAELKRADQLHSLLTEAGAVDRSSPGIERLQLRVVLNQTVSHLFIKFEAGSGFERQYAHCQMLELLLRNGRHEAREPPSVPEKDL